MTDVQAVVAQADLSYRVRGDTEVTFTAERDISYSFERAAPYFVADRYGLAVSRRLGRQLDLSGSASRDHYGYRAGGRGRDVRWNVIAELGYRLSSTTRAGVQVGYIEHHSTTRARRRYDGVVLGFIFDYDI